MPNNSSLQLSADEMRQLGYRVVDQLVEHFETLNDKPVMLVSPRTELEPRLREALPEQPADAGALLEQLQRDVWSNIGNVQHPRFFAFIPSPSNFVSVMADALASGFNPFAGNWLEGAGTTQLELVVVDWLRQMCGLPETAGGLFVSGGSMANLTALAAARGAKLGGQTEHAVIYFSDQTHSSLEKALRILGFAREQIRKLPSDEQFRLRMAELRQAVAADRAAGRRPFCIIANAGTTNTGAIDPLGELADFCAAEDLWLHVDGAYGAAAAVCERGKHLLAGIERADSVTLDPHKWLFQPFEIGCILLRDARLLKKTFHTMAEYLEDTKRAEEQEINYYDYGPQLTRGFRALKLWLSLKTFGAAAFRQAIEHGFELAELAENILRRSPNWQIVSQATMGIVTFRFVPPEATESEVNEIHRRMVEAMVTDGFVFANSTALRGQTVMRLCTINPRTTTEDIHATIQKLDQLARTATNQVKNV
ncbi:MAG TPA: aminotransferase class V-fold PLP-dependent enzyme [Blastocatellia bacterium]|nr:aminotransferase class V-fold PLP-dependent enzyme [Blastocatellia bacterium]HMV86481.1 aminotransferase class V-fold PLP-dependent enzyme [Blastocatellia bacterium]HMY73131.1 aminotransferase class V-fold PLP-dependent enzyme [Blastocatellia bacterium]HMZ18360.1 aminotransferase class V-fold PLP-dependent enzyme [Blastocatellia bacterium]HNG31713.1 aminotransferase class V-fold PLP-dependent enzyme [Blastocatellia bacterium]